MLDGRTIHLERSSQRFRWFARRIFAAVGALVLASPAAGQSLEQRLDNEQYLRALRDLRLPEVLDEYLRLHPPADDVESAVQALARQQAALGAIEPGEQRAQAIDALLQARAALIQSHPADPRRAVWLADQAAELWFEALANDALGLIALVGMPDDSQRGKASAYAVSLNQSARDAEQAIDSAIRAVEGRSGFATDPILQQRRRQLADVERDRRIPFLRGVGAYVDAALNVDDEAERQSAWTLANQTLAPLTESLEGSLAIQARLFDGLALARLGRFDDAETRFASVARDPKATAAEVFMARMGGVLNRFVRSGPASALEGLASVEQRYREPDQVFYRVLIADQEFRLRRALANASPEAQRGAIMAEAFAAYTALLQLDYPPGSVSRDTLRSIVFARLTLAAAGSDLPLDDLPPIVAIARAEALARDESTREQAVLSLEEVLKGAALVPDDRAAALFALGKALFESDQPLLAAQRFLELARDHATDSQAERAIELAATLATDEYREAPGDADVRATARQALDLLLSRYPNLRSIDRWQYAAGRLALDEARYDDAQRHYAKVTPDATQWLDANFMQAAAARQRSQSAGDDGASAEAHQQTRDVVARVRPTIENGRTQASGADRRAALDYYLAMLRVFDAEALLGLKQPQSALEALAGIEDQPGIDSSALGEAMRVRINAYQSLQPPRPEDALRDLQRFIAAAPAQAGAALQPMVASLCADVQKLIDEGRDDNARDLAQRTLLPAARTLLEWLNTPDAPSDPAARLALERRVADALRLAGECEQATQLYSKALQAEPGAAELLLGQAECLFALGGDERMAQAMGLYKRLAAAGPAAGHDAYWLAQLRMLQVLDLTNRNTQQIVPRIERLRQSDANFGGERYRRGFDALRAKHARASG